MLEWAADLPVLAVAAGLAALIAGADLLVRGAVRIALTLGTSEMTVGLTLVALGTSMPELLVSVTAARMGSAEIAIANVIGSNTANVLLIVGLAAAICAVRVQVRWLELGYLLVATGLACVPFALGAMERLGAIAMVAMLVAFCAHLVRRERADTPPTDAPRPPRAGLVGWIAALGLVGAGLALLAIGAEWLVTGGRAIATSVGISETVVGMTIVAIGTSLPELATSVVAALRRQPEIAIGNILGSNVFNVGAVLGLAGLIHPFSVDRTALGLLLAATVASAIALTIVLRLCRGVPRAVGVVFLVAYAGLLAAELWRSRAA